MLKKLIGIADIVTKVFVKVRDQLILKYGSERVFFVVYFNDAVSTIGWYPYIYANSGAGRFLPLF